MPSKELLNGKRPTTQTHRRECSSLWLQITFKHATCKLTAMNYNNKASGKQAKKESVVEFKNKNVEKQQELLTTYTQTILVCLQKKKALVFATPTTITIATYKPIRELSCYFFFIYFSFTIDKLKNIISQLSCWILISDANNFALCQTHTHTRIHKSEAKQGNAIGKCDCSGNVTAVNNAVMVRWKGCTIRWFVLQQKLGLWSLEYLKLSFSFEDIVFKTLISYFKFIWN